MAGLTDYAAQNYLNWETGQRAMPAVPAVYVGLFTTAPTTDAGVTGATEASGTAYARVQISGTVAATASWTTGTSITMTTNPGWVVAGMNVYDSTNSQQIGTVSTYVTTALTLVTGAAHASSGSTDNLVFSAFAPSVASTGTEPVVTPAQSANTNTVVTFAQAGASWGTVTSLGFFDALTAGNCLRWDFLGNFKWLPFSGTLASPSVLTVPAHGFSNGDTVIVTSKTGGTLPSAGSWAGALTVAGVATDTFTAGVNAASASGDGLVRKITTQAIASGVTMSITANTMIVSLA
jgi:hypothetical protein